MFTLLFILWTAENYFKILKKGQMKEQLNQEIAGELKKDYHTDFDII